MKIEETSIILPLPTQKDIEKEESYWKVTLPIEYATFISKYNGAVPITNVFTVSSHEYVIERFLCILKDSENNKLGMYDIDVVLSQIEDRLTDNEDLVGVELLPIASLFGGDFLCLSFKDREHPPTVGVWKHEESSELEPVFLKGFSSFKEFLANLTE
ncbi:MULTISPECIES: SMI1/KNR4 family protein [Listeria]|uniref:SMI1/KNR4 family protein n=1 Tax=Listeria TaxID=1637 RepID=UPI000B58DE41|nr:MULTISPECIES: SMI1/KNR4 family protein [Listeria]